MSYQEYKEEAKRLTDIVDTISLELNGFPKTVNGMTVEHIRMSPSYQASKKKYAAAFKKMADHNRKMVKLYKKELSEDRMKERLEKRSQ